MTSCRPRFARSADPGVFTAIAALALVALTSVSAGCGGETVGIGGGAGSGSGSGSGSAGGGTTVVKSTGSGGQTCVDVSISAAARACHADSDCTFGPTGQVCDSSCECGGTPMSTVAASALRAELSADLPPSSGPACECPVAGEPRCIADTCVVCGAPGEPAGCIDSGVVISPPPPPPDAGTCVFVDIGTYDTSCTTASDCVLIGQGDICPGSCGNCPTAPVNASEEARYASAIQGVDLSGICSCPAVVPLSCLGGTCVACYPGNPACEGTRPPPEDAGARPPKDAGVRPPQDAGVRPSKDAGVLPPKEDASACIDVDLASYDRACTQASDCLLIVSGEVCGGGCALCNPNAAINTSGAARYDSTIAPVTAGDVCACPLVGTAECLAGQCVMCGSDHSGCRADAG